MRGVLIGLLLLVAPLGAAAPATFDAWYALTVDIQPGGFYIVKGTYRQSAPYLRGYVHETPSGTSVGVADMSEPARPAREDPFYFSLHGQGAGTTRVHLLYWFGGLEAIGWANHSGGASVVQRWSGSDGMLVDMGEGWGGVRTPLPAGGAVATVGLERTFEVRHTLYGAVYDTAIRVPEGCEKPCMDFDPARVLVIDGPEGIDTGNQIWFGAPPGTYALRADGVGMRETPILGLADLDTPWD